MKLKEKRKCLGKEFRGIFSEELPWRVVQLITSDEDHDCFGEISNNSTRRVVQYFYRNSVVCFREQKFFVLKTVFSHTWFRQV